MDLADHVSQLLTTAEKLTQLTLMNSLLYYGNSENFLLVFGEGDNYN